MPTGLDPKLHPGRTASLWLNGQKLGYFGQLHPQLRQEKDLPPAAVYVFQLNHRNDPQLPSRRRAVSASI